VSDFDVFLSHSNPDKPIVEQLARKLEDEADIKPFLDIWHLIPGEPWQEAIEDVLDKATCCAVFVGKGGITPWEHEEMRLAISRRVGDKRFRVIPVLLPGSNRPERGGLPKFLTRATWVEFRTSIDDSDAFHRLICGIKGIPPGRKDQKKTKNITINPYQGLKAFEREHAHFFYGRESAVGWLIDKLRRTRFLAVVGPSGSGKSSLVRAGLIPAIEQGDIQDDEDWKISIFKPGYYPLESLVAVLLSLYNQELRPPTAHQLLKDLEENERSLHLQASTLLHNDDSSKIVLVIDQFEEVFTQCTNEDERIQFINQIQYASTIAGGKVVIILTIRADFYGKCSEYPDLAANITDHQMLVSPMSNEELRSAIESPASLVGLTIEPGLVETLLRDLTHEKGALPLLQHTLLELWLLRDQGRLSLKAYQEIGGISGSLTKRANSVFDSLKDKEKALVRHIMLQLVEPGEGTPDTRRRAAISELVSASVTEESIVKLVQILAAEKVRLLTTDKDSISGEMTVEVSHEALLREWGQLNSWINEKRDFLSWRQRLRAALQQWKRFGKDSGSLLQGLALTEAEKQILSKNDELSREEYNYIELSKQKREQGHKQKQEAKRIFATSESRRIATVLSRFRSNQLSLALLLGREAFLYRKTIEAQIQLANIMLDYYSLRTTLRGYEQNNEVSSSVNSVAFSPSGNYVVSGADDGTVRIWEVSKLQIGKISPLHRLKNGTIAVRSVAFSPDENHVISGGDDGTVRIWNIASGNQIGAPLGRQESNQDNPSFMIRSVAFSPDGTYVVSGGDDGFVRIWEVSSRLQIGEFKPFPSEDRAELNSVTSVIFSSDGYRVISGGDDGSIRIWEVSSGQQIGKPLWGHKKRNGSIAVRSVAISPDDTQVVSGGDDGTVRIWNIEPSDSLERIFQVHKTIIHGSSPVRSVAISPDGTHVISSGDDGAVRIWELASGTHIGTPLRGHEEGNDGYISVRDLAFSSDGTSVVSGGNDGTVRIWKLEFGLQIKSPFRGHGDDYIDRLTESLYSNIEGNRVVIGGNDDTLRISRDGVIPPITVPDASDLSGKSFARSVFEKAFPYMDFVALKKHYYGILEKGIDYILKGQKIKITSVNSIVFSPDGTHVISGGDDGTIRIWEIESGLQIREPFQGHDWSCYKNSNIPSFSISINSVAISSNADRLISGGDDGTVRIWNMESGLQIVKPLHSHRKDSNGYNSVRSVALNHDGTRLVSGGNDGVVRIWEIESGLLIGALSSKQDEGNDLSVIVASVDMSQDGAYVVSGGSDGTVRIWNVNSGLQIGAPLRGHELGMNGYNSVRCVAFSPDGTRVVSGGDDGTVRIWDVKSGLQIGAPLRGHEVGMNGYNSVRCVAFSPDGTCVVSSGDDGTVRIWDVKSGLQIGAPLRGHEAGMNGYNSVRCVAFSPDGTRVVSGGDDGTVRFWDVDFNSWIDRVCYMAGRNLSLFEWREFMGSDIPYRRTCKQFPSGHGAPEDALLSSYLFND